MAMIIALAGSTGTARELIVDSFLGNHADWRHLAIEDIIEDDAIDPEDGADMGQLFGVMVACEAAQGEVNEGYSVIITLPAHILIKTVLDQFEDAVCVSLGDPLSDTEELFEHIIDSSSQSVAATNEALEGIIAEHSDLD